MTPFGRPVDPDENGKQATSFIGSISILSGSSCPWSLIMDETEMKPSDSPNTTPY